MRSLSDVQLLAIGYVTSVAVAAILLALNFGSLESIAIGFLMAVLTTLLRLKADLSKNHDECLEAMELNKGLNEDDSFRKAIYVLAKDYIEIKTSKREQQLLLVEAQKAVNDCVAAVAELANGRLSIDEEHRRQILMQRVVAESTQSIKAITYLAAGFDGWWSGSLGRKYFKEQDEAIRQRGVSITRIFIISDQETENLRQRFHEQISIGIHVRVVELELLPKALRRNFLICDDLWLIDSRFNREGKNDGGHISIDEADIHAALEKWNDLMGLSEPVNDVGQFTNPKALSPAL